MFPLRLLGIGALLTLAASAAPAQVAPPRSPLPRATQNSAVPSVLPLGVGLGVSSVRLQPAGSLVGPGRLGISAPSVATAAARDPLAAVRAASLRHRGPGVALMLVGAAGVITGLLIDESVVTIAGAGVGLVGLYLYLR